MQLFADVVVFAPTDPTKSFFTYAIPEKLSKGIGTNVPVPKGIVIDHRAREARRSVSRFARQADSLEIGQLVSVPWGKKLAQGIVIEIKNETQVKNPKSIQKIIFSTPLLQPKYIELLKWMSWYYHASMLDCLKAMLPKFRYQTSDFRFQQGKIRNQKAESRKQTLILVPTITQIQPVLNQLKDTEGILIYHKQLPKKELWRSWWQIYQGDVVKIIGTRSAIFTQCQNLSEIRIIDEEDSGFKDERSPYFDTLNLAAKLSELTKAKLTIDSFTPRVETYLTFRKKLTKNLPKVRPKITIVNLISERKLGKNLYISDLLRDLMIAKINEKKPVLLFLNRIKESGQIFCAECKFSGFSQSVPRVCPNCQAANFKFYSLNLKSIGRQVLKLIPTVGLKLASRGKIVTLKKGRGELTLATSAILSQILTKFSLIGIISADTILNLPDFQSSFRTFSTLVKISQLADKDGEVLIQTYNPKHLAIAAFANYDFERFYAEELILRKKLEFPPFRVLARLSIKRKRAEAAKVEAEKLASILQKKTLLVDIQDPVENWQGKPEFHIIVAAAKREELDLVLNYVPTKWKVVIDPASLL